VTGPSVDRRRILVVDDQPTLTRAIRRMLAHHDVTTAGSARDALARIEAGERFDVILSDLMMPEMNGMELYSAIARVAPELIDKIVFMTGGAFTPQARTFFDRVANRTIEKPFDRAILVDVIDDMLR
jgi:CheY-like chemotaxis protein